MNKKHFSFIIILSLVIFLACKDSPEINDDIMSLPPLKDQFSKYFDMGNVFNTRDVSGGRISNERLTRHYNVLTAENHMKPSYLSPSRGSYNFTHANSMVDAAIASGFKVVGHTLLWHSQIPGWQANLRNDNTSPAVALQYMKDYITSVVTEFKGRVYKWDVLNEAFPEGGYSATWRTSMRSGSQGNPWFMKIGADFVYEGFLAARLADPDAILYYNDYNLNHNNPNVSVTSKTTMVRDMVRDVNQQYKDALPALKVSYPQIDLSRTDKLIEGIGLQSHHNTGVTPESVSRSFDIFRPLGVKISISELDVLSQSYGDFEDKKSPTEAGKTKAAELYGEYFKVFLNNADIIERVTFWGVTDNESWRAAGLPLLFDSKGAAKPAYNKIIEALESISRN